MPNTSSSRGFTLIELLVVISIISLLISILLPALQHARGSAQNIQCMSNMRGIGQACVTYAHDYDNYFPLAREFSVAQPSPAYYGWPRNSLMPYLGVQTITSKDAVGILACPVYTAADRRQNTHSYVTYSVNGHYGSALGSFPNNTTWSYSAYDIDQLGRTHPSPLALGPSEKGYLIDGVRDNQWVNFQARQNSIHPESSNGGVLNLHIAGSDNMLFFDGHVVTLPGDTFSGGANTVKLWHLYW